MGEIKDAPWYVRFPWVAQDKDRCVWAYNTRPHVSMNGTAWRTATKGTVFPVFIGSQLLGINNENWDKECYQIETTPDGSVSITTHRPEE